MHAPAHRITRSRQHGQRRHLLVPASLQARGARQSGQEQPSEQLLAILAAPADPGEHRPGRPVRRRGRRHLGAGAVLAVVSRNRRDGASLRTADRPAAAPATQVEAADRDVDVVPLGLLGWLRLNLAADADAARRRTRAAQWGRRRGQSDTPTQPAQPLQDRGAASDGGDARGTPRQRSFLMPGPLVHDCTGGPGGNTFFVIIV